MFSKRGKGGTKETIYKIIKEAIYTRRAAHKNVTAVYDLIETKERLLIIFELVEGGELYKEVVLFLNFSPRPKRHPHPTCHGRYSGGSIFPRLWQTASSRR